MYQSEHGIYNHFTFLYYRKASGTTCKHSNNKFNTSFENKSNIFTVHSKYTKNIHKSLTMANIIILSGKMDPRIASLTRLYFAFQVVENHSTLIFNSKCS